jgi:hypothetical protein
MDTYNKKRQGGDEKIKIPKVKVEKKENPFSESKINNLKDIINDANQKINEKIENINSLKQENKNETLNINDIKLNENKNEENKNEKEYSLENNGNKKFSNLNITEEYLNNKKINNSNNDIKEEIQSSSNNIKLTGNDKISFAEKIIENSQNQPLNSMNVDMTQTNYDLLSNYENQSQINKENEKEKVIEYLVTTTNFRIDGKKKENKNKIEKLDDINIKQKEIKAKDKLIENINKINLNELKNYELNELEKKLENLLDEIRVKTGNNSKDPTMEKLLEKYSVLLVDRINKKINK